jgi:hypothetical protein
MGLLNVTGAKPCAAIVKKDRLASNAAQGLDVTK